MLKHIHRLAAVAMVAFNAIGTAIWSRNLLNWYTALTIATGDAHPRTFGTAGADALTKLYVDMYNSGVGIAFVFAVRRHGHRPRVVRTRWEQPQ